MSELITSEEIRKNTVEKSIYFYRAKVNNMPNLYELFKSYSLTLNNYKREVGDTFDNLKDSGLILKNPKDKNRYFFLDIVNLSKEKIECIIYSLRGSAFPYLFDIFTGEKKEIPHTMNDTIMDQTHFIVYPDVSIIATEFNYHGCRLERIPDILDKVFAKKNIIELAPILNMGATEELVYEGTFKGFDLKVAYPALSQIQNALGLGILPEFDDNFTVLDNMYINIGINNTSGLNLVDKNNFVQNIVKLVNSVKDQFTDEDGFVRKYCPLKIAKIHTKPLSNTKSLTIDLFEEKLLSKVYPIKLNNSSKYIDSNDMFSCINRSFNENKIDIINDFDTSKIANG